MALWRSRHSSLCHGDSKSLVRRCINHARHKSKITKRLPQSGNNRNDAIVSYSESEASLKWVENTNTVPTPLTTLVRRWPDIVFSFVDIHRPSTCFLVRDGDGIARFQHRRNLFGFPLVATREGSREVSKGFNFKSDRPKRYHFFRAKGRN